MVLRYLEAEVVVVQQLHALQVRVEPLARRLPLHFFSIPNSPTTGGPITERAKARERENESNETREKERETGKNARTRAEMLQRAGNKLHSLPSLRDGETLLMLLLREPNTKKKVLQKEESAQRIKNPTKQINTLRSESTRYM